MDDKPPLKGRGLGNVTHFKFWGYSHISGTAEAKVVTFGVHIHKLSPNWRGQCHVSDPYLNFEASIVSLEWMKIGTSISNLVCCLMLSSTSTCIIDYPRVDVFKA